MEVDNILRKEDVTRLRDWWALVNFWASFYCYFDQKFLRSF